MIRDVLTVALVFAGLCFFTAGTVGLLRFPDLLSRLHALTKADTLGLGLILLGLMAQAGSLAEAAKLALIGAMALLAAAANAALLARDVDPGS